MTTYNWSIALTEYTNDADKAVVTAHWRVSAVDGDYTASSYGTAGFMADPSDPGYIPYADLTEADVLGWVWGQSENWKADMEASFAAQIEDQKAPATESGLPWA